MKLSFTMLVTFLTIFYNICSGQENAKSEERQSLKLKRKFKNDLSIDLKSIGINSIFNGASLLYQHSYNKGKLINVDVIRTFRIGLTLDIQDNLNERHDSIVINSSDPRTTSGYTLIAQNKYNIELIIGLQRQKSINKIILYRGIDAILSYFYYDDDFTNATFNKIDFDFGQTTDYSIRVSRFGVNPFFGLRYYFYNNLYASIETGIFAGYFHSNANHFADPNPIKSNGFLLRYNGIRFIQVGYVF